MEWERAELIVEARSNARQTDRSCKLMRVGMDSGFGRCNQPTRLLAPEHKASQEGGHLGGHYSASLKNSSLLELDQQRRRGTRFRIKLVDRHKSQVVKNFRLVKGEKEQQTTSFTGPASVGEPSKLKQGRGNQSSIVALAKRVSTCRRLDQPASDMLVRKGSPWPV